MATIRAWPAALLGNRLASVWLRSQLKLLLLIAPVIGLLVAGWFGALIYLQSSPDRARAELQGIQAEWPVLLRFLQADPTQRATVARWLIEYGIRAEPIQGTPGRYRIAGTPYATADLCAWIEAGQLVDPSSGQLIETAPPAWQAALRDSPPARVLPATMQGDPSRPAWLLILPVAENQGFAVRIPQKMLSAGESAALVGQIFAITWLGTTIALIVLAVLLGARRARRDALSISAPLLRLQEAMAKFSAGELEVRAEPGGTDEARDLALRFNSLAETLQGMVNDLRRATDAQRRFIAEVSHELGNPLTLIIGQAEHLERQDQVADDVRIILDAALTMRLLIQDLVSIAEIDVAAIGVKPVATDVHAVATRAVMAFGLAADRAGVKIELSGQAKSALADSQRLQQVLANLIANALRHTPPGGVISVRILEARDAIELCVADTGAGMSAEDAQRAFERGFSRRADARFGSSGLGLAISRKLVEAMQGSISLTSALGEGTVVRIALRHAA